MSFFFAFSVMGLEATVDEVCDRRRCEVRVFKQKATPDRPAHVSFAGSDSLISSRQAMAIAGLIQVGARMAEAFDTIQPLVTSLGKLVLKYDAQVGLEIELTPDERNVLDQVRVLDHLLALLSALTAQSIESLLRTVKRRSWQDLRGLPAADFENLLIKGSPESTCELL